MNEDKLSDADGCSRGGRMLNSTLRRCRLLRARCATSSCVSVTLMWFRQHRSTPFLIMRLHLQQDVSRCRQLRLSCQSTSLLHVIYHRSHSGGRWKWRTRKWRTIEMSRHEIDGHENDGHENAGHVSGVWIRPTTLNTVKCTVLFQRHLIFLDIHILDIFVDTVAF